MYTLYIPNEEINIATSYYVKLVQESLKLKNEDYKIVHEIDKIPADSTVFVISIVSLVKLKVKRPLQPFSYWFQGIVPEELELLYSGAYNRIKIKLYPYIERYILRKAEWVLFVSEAMKEHYERKYQIVPRKYSVVPCVNLEIDEASFFIPKKYKSPTFVYAGNLASWQMVDLILQIFKAVSKKIPNSKLLIFTNEIEQANLLVEKEGIQNVLIEYVVPSVLQKRLYSCKYGFVIRENIAVNNVATPTKINSYMASGIIPIVSDCIIDFNKQSEKMEYVIKVSSENLKSVETIAEQIVSFEKLQINPERVFSEYSYMFNTYYSINQYKERISKLL